MTKEQKILVRHTWQFFGNVDPTLIGDVFYDKLFILDPSLKPLFKSSRDEQSRKLVAMLGMIVARIDRLDELTSGIIELARRHKGYGVQDRHYQVVGAALLWTLQQGLGPDWNDAVEEAWTACYQILSAKMIDADIAKVA